MPDSLVPFSLSSGAKRLTRVGPPRFVGRQVKKWTSPPVPASSLVFTVPSEVQVRGYNNSEKEQVIYDSYTNSSPTRRPPARGFGGDSTRPPDH